MCGPVWTVELVHGFIALAGATRVTTDQGQPYEVFEWRSTDSTHEIDVLGYYEVTTDRWVWRAEFAVGTRFPGRRGVFWHTNGRGTEAVEGESFDAIVVAVTRWLNELPELCKQLPYAAPDLTQERIFPFNTVGSRW